MKTFEQKVWSDADPAYAPGLTWSNDTHPRWKAPKRYVEAGYIVTGTRLDGHRGDGLDMDRAAACRVHARAMLRWWQDQDRSGPAPDTWAWLIARYRGDDISPYLEVKANTRAGYADLLGKWEGVIGHMNIADLTYEQIMTVRRAMEKNGRSLAYIRRMFVMLRTVAGYGKALRNTAARDVSDVLSEMRFKMPPPRTAAPTRAQIEAIVVAADAKGLHAFACGLLMQYELMLRAVDVRGQWLKDDGQAGGIHKDGLRWQDGLTWDMVDADCTGFVKVISKTARSMPEPYHFDLTNLPDVRRRLLALQPADRIGPVIVSKRFGLPYTIYGWSQNFRRLRDALGLPDTLTMMDTRAGGITEASGLVTNAHQLRHAAQHKNLATTDRYARDKSDAANNVIALRKGEK